MTQNINKLHYPENWPDIEPKQISRLFGVPIVNLLLKFNIGFTKYSYAYREILKQLNDRGAVPLSVWGDDPRRLQIAKVLEKVAQEHIWGSDVYFFPEDSFDIVYNLTIGDLCEVEAIMELEEIFKQKFTDEFLGLLYKADMCEAIDLFIGEIKPDPKEIDKYLDKFSKS